MQISERYDAFKTSSSTSMNFLSSDIQKMSLTLAEYGLAINPEPDLKEKSKRTSPTRNDSDPNHSRYCKILESRTALRFGLKIT